MALTKQDKQDLAGIVKTQVVEAVKDLPTKAEVKNIVGTAVDEGVETLAAMVKRGFDSVDEKFAGVDRQLATIKSDVAHVNFQLTETVHRGEFLDLKQRVDKLEKKG